jgi:sterol desaturase/sphingolipid hydroxylase (fatty acid hydroxylase superfamily)
MPHVDVIFGHLEAIYAASLVGASQFWGRGLASFVLIGAILCGFSLRGGSLPSLRKLPGHLFPPGLYLERTARISHWNFLIVFLIWGPLFTVVSFDVFKLSEGVDAFLVGQFGALGPWFEARWAIVTAQTIALVLCMSLAAYLVHLAQHKIPVLWSLHRAHHTVEALTLPALTRIHPIEFLMNGIGISVGAGLPAGLILYALGLGKPSPSALGIIGAMLGWRVVHGIFEHGHVPISFGPLNRVISGPILHQIHHSSEPRHRDKNMGGMFPLSIWDWMFGTLYLPEKGETYRWGLNQAEIGPNNPHMTMREFYVEPVRHAWSVIKGRGRAAGTEEHHVSASSAGG